MKAYDVMKLMIYRRINPQINSEGITGRKEEENTELKGKQPLGRVISIGKVNIKLDFW
jgi:hypothetical protein